MVLRSEFSSRTDDGSVKSLIFYYNAYYSIMILYTYIFHRIPVTMDSYLGYSLAISDTIDSGSNTSYYISGAPRGNDTGAVLFFTEDLDGKHADLQT